MFVVYKITNLIENKCYIGSSIRVEKRWRQHINTSNNPNSPQYNYPLYEAFRQFGIENFIFEIIADDFETIWEMEEYEQQMIDFYNSVCNERFSDTDYDVICLDYTILKYIKQMKSREIHEKCKMIEISEDGEFEFHYIKKSNVAVYIPALSKISLHEIESKAIEIQKQLFKIIRKIPKYYNNNDAYFMKRVIK